RRVATLRRELWGALARFGAAARSLARSSRRGLTAAEASGCWISGDASGGETVAGNVPPPASAGVGAFSARVGADGNVPAPASAGAGAAGCDLLLSAAA